MNWREIREMKMAKEKQTRRRVQKPAPERPELFDATDAMGYIGPGEKAAMDKLISDTLRDLPPYQPSTKSNAEIDAEVERAIFNQPPVKSWVRLGEVADEVVKQAEKKMVSSPYDLKLKAFIARIAGDSPQSQRARMEGYLNNLPQKKRLKVMHKRAFLKWAQAVWR